MPSPHAAKPLSIVITGATSGIGLQLAMDYLSQGHEVYTVGRNSDVLHTLAKGTKAEAEPTVTILPLVALRAGSSASMACTNEP